MENVPRPAFRRPFAEPPTLDKVKVLATVLLSVGLIILSMTIAFSDVPRPRHGCIQQNDWAAFSVEVESVASALEERSRRVAVVAGENDNEKLMAAASELIRFEHWLLSPAVCSREARR